MGECQQINTEVLSRHTSADPANWYRGQLQSLSFKPWLETPLCGNVAWPGVTCVEGQLREIRLEGVPLNRSLPARLGNLTGLQRFILVQNGLTGW